MNANIQIQKKGTYLIDICGFHLDFMKGPFSQFIKWDAYDRDSLNGKRQ